MIHLEVSESQMLTEESDDRFILKEFLMIMSLHRAKSVGFGSISLI